MSYICRYNVISCIIRQVTWNKSSFRERKKEINKETKKERKKEKEARLR
jgi:hypothetical protein